MNNQIKASVVFGSILAGSLLFSISIDQKGALAGGDKQVNICNDTGTSLQIYFGGDRYDFSSGQCGNITFYSTSSIKFDVGNMRDMKQIDNHNLINGKKYSFRLNDDGSPAVFPKE